VEARYAFGTRHADNTPAIALYERAGFGPTEGGAMGEPTTGEIRLLRSLMR
jgi:hypothetical protein